MIQTTNQFINNHYVLQPVADISGLPMTPLKAPTTQSKLKAKCVAIAMKAYLKNP